MSQNLKEVLDLLISLGGNQERLARSTKIHEDASGALHMRDCDTKKVMSAHIYTMERIARLGHTCIDERLFTENEGSWGYENSLLRAHRLIEAAIPEGTSDLVDYYLQLRDVLDETRRAYGFPKNTPAETVALGNTTRGLQVAAKSVHDVLVGAHRERLDDSVNTGRWVAVYHRYPKWQMFRTDDRWDSINAARGDLDFLVTHMIESSDETLLSVVPHQVALNLGALDNEAFETLTLGPQDTRDVLKVAGSLWEPHQYESFNGPGKFAQLKYAVEAARLVTA